MKLWRVFVVVLLLFGACFRVSAMEYYQCSGNLFNDLSSSEPQQSFSVLDKIFLKITCHDLPKGNYSIVSDWINPHGKLSRQNVHRFEVKEPGDYMSYSWMKLLRKGPLQRNLTGMDVDHDNIGEWVVKAYIQGKEISEWKFNVN